MAREPIDVHVVADSTGTTGTRVANAAAQQYADYELRIIRHPHISTEEGAIIAIDGIELGDTRVVVFCTVMDDKLRAVVSRRCIERGIPHADLLEPAIDALRQATGADPDRVVRPVGVEGGYYDRIAAMEFALVNDDGSITHPLHRADIVLTGASRTGKTPLSIYLGYLGYRTANVPLVASIAPPPELFEVEKWKIIGLTIDPEVLQLIRQRRVRALGSPHRRDGYTDLGAIYEELETVKQLHRKLGCPVIDTTSLALEEAAGQVVELIRQRRAKILGG